MPWRDVLLSLNALAVALAGCAALVCFVAYNWEAMHRFARIGLVAAGFVLPCAVAFWRAGAGAVRDVPQQALLLAAMLAVGGLFALVGQVYQTGADTWQLFALWAALGGPFALLARGWLVWLVWFGLADVAWAGALSMAWGLDERTQCMALAAWHGAAAWGFAVCGEKRTHGGAREARWLWAAALGCMMAAAVQEAWGWEAPLTSSLLLLLAAQTVARCGTQAKALAAWAAGTVLVAGAMWLGGMAERWLENDLVQSLVLLLPAVLLVAGGVWIRRTLFAGTAGAEPWWWRALQALLAWVAAGFMISAVGTLLAAPLLLLLVGNEDSLPPVMALFGAAGVWAGTALVARAHTRFWRQTALPVHLAGQALLYAAVCWQVALRLLPDDEFAALLYAGLLCAALAALLGWFMRSRHRGLAIFCAAVALGWLAVAHATALWHPRDGLAFTHPALAPAAALLPSALLTLALAHGWPQPMQANRILAHAAGIALLLHTLLSALLFVPAPDMISGTVRIAGQAQWPLAAFGVMLLAALAWRVRRMGARGTRAYAALALCALPVWLGFFPPWIAAPLGTAFPMLTANLLAAPLLYFAAVAGGQRGWALVWLAMIPLHFFLAYYTSVEVSLLTRAAQFAALAACWLLARIVYTRMEAAQ